MLPRETAAKCGHPASPHPANLRYLPRTSPTLGLDPHLETTAEAMNFAPLGLAMTIALGCSMLARSGLAQSNDATPQGADAAAAESITAPEACRQRLDALHVTFTFVPAVAEGDCAIPLPVRLQSLTIDGGNIAFSAMPILDCRLVARLADWIGNVVEPLARHHLGSRLTALETGPGYACRKRNNQAGGKISEHAKGNALDIAAFALSDGRRIAVRPPDPVAPAITGFLAAVRTTACGYFLTVLGPGSDAAHTEHLHLDLGPHGRTSNYRICQ
jgi:hypothetical protein